MFNFRALDTIGEQITDLFFNEEEIEVDEDELAELELLDEIPLLWRGSIGDGELSAFTPVFYNDSIYAADESGDITRFDATTGERIWRIDTEHKLSGGVGVANGMVLVGTFKGKVLVYDEAGNSQWQAQVSSEVLNAPQLEDNTVVVRTGDGRIFGLDALDGSRKWVYQGATPSLTVRSAAGALISRGAVFAGFAGGKLTAISLLNGNIGWESAVSQPSGVTELERMTDVTSLPVADDHLVCAVAYQGRVACFDLTDGSQIWAREVSSSAGLAADNDYIFVSKDGGTVIAYDKISGAGVWKQERLGSRKISAPLVWNHNIVVGDFQGYVTLLRGYDGAVISRSATDGSAIITPPKLLPNGFMVQTLEGGIYVFTTDHNQ